MNPGAVCGWVGVVAGCAVGLAGGIVGTYCGVRNTNGPLERSFMIRSAVVCWAAVGIFLGALLALPDPYRWLVWIPYAILLPLGVTSANRKQQAIRRKESLDRQADEPGGRQ